jgi:hypothetical protein
MAWRIAAVLTANDVTLDTLAGDWRIFQLRTGHRFSADDLLTAWAAVRAKPEALRLLDLGSVGRCGCNPALILAAVYGNILSRLLLQPGHTSNGDRSDHSVPAEGG